MCQRSHADSAPSLLVLRCSKTSGGNVARDIAGVICEKGSRDSIEPRVRLHHIIREEIKTREEVILAPALFIKVSLSPC